MNWKVTATDFNESCLLRLKQICKSANIKQEEISPIKSKIRGDGQITLYKSIISKEPFATFKMNSRQIIPYKNELLAKKEDRAHALPFNYSTRILLDEIIRDVESLTSGGVAASEEEEKREGGGGKGEGWKDSLKESDLLFYFRKRFDLVISARFLERSILKLCVPYMVKLGGFVFVWTFLEGADKVGKMSPKNPRFLLKKGELVELFCNKNWKDDRDPSKQFTFEAVVDKTMYLNDGRPMQAFIAKKIPIW